MPTWEGVKSRLPPDLTAKPTRMLWALFGYEYAWGYARKLTARPWELTAADYRGLEK